MLYLRKNVLVCQDQFEIKVLYSKSDTGVRNKDGFVMFAVKRSGSKEIFSIFSSIFIRTPIQKKNGYIASSFFSHLKYLFE